MTINYAITAEWVVISGWSINKVGYYSVLNNKHLKQSFNQFQKHGNSELKHLSCSETITGRGANGQRRE